MPQPWTFFRAGGVDQVRLTKGAELAALGELDQKLWVALSCPVKGLEFDERTLALIDSDKDGRVRAPELIAAGKWAASLLSDVESLAKGSESLPLSAITEGIDEGKVVQETARALLKALGKPEATSISVSDMEAAVKAFDKEHENGDGIVPVDAVTDEELKKLVGEVLGCTAGPKTDRSGAPGLDSGSIDAFFVAAQEHLAWLDAGKADGVQFLGEASGVAIAALHAVEAKVDDFFARTQVAAFDARALGALNRDAAAYGAFTEKALSAGAAELADFPLAQVTADAPLPLQAGLNPAWRDRVAAFRAQVVTPIVGERDTLTAADWAQIKAKAAPHRAWWADKKGASVEGLGRDRLQALVASDAKDKLHALVAADAAAAPRAASLDTVDKLVRLHRDLMALANNFVSFRDFYSRKRPAIFQVGTLYLDQRACELCVAVNDAGRHATMAPNSRAYLVYCDLTNAKGEKRAIVAAVTDGDVDNLMVGRNGIFYDRKGKDWDATVTKIVDNPISIRQAFWSPYKKLLKLVEDQINKRAAAAAAEADAKVTAGAAHIETATTQPAPAAAPAAPAAPKKLDIGVVAALGVAVGGITAALGALLEAFFGLGMWMPLGILGLILVISGPSMAIAWLKLRQRNIGPILDANGWAVNALTRVNVPLGRSLTSVAELPQGSSRDLADPFEEEKKPWWLVMLLIVLGTLGLLWLLGTLDPVLPEGATKAHLLSRKAETAAPAEASAPAAP